MHLGGISYSGQGSQSLLYYVARDNLGKIHTYNRTFYIRTRVILGHSQLFLSGYVQIRDSRHHHYRTRFCYIPLHRSTRLQSTWEILLDNLGTFH